MAAPQDPISPGSSAAQTWKLLTVARIKPLGEGATASVIKADDSSVVVHRDPSEVADDDEEDAPGGTAAFALDKVCGPEAPQEEVYGLLKPVVTGATKGRNGCVFAYGQTGSGKTVAYGLAIGATLLGEAEAFGRAGQPLALIIAPTRELALQVQRELAWLYKHANARIIACVGGMDPRREAALLDEGAHVVVGTPGSPIPVGRFSCPMNSTLITGGMSPIFSTG